MVKRQKKKKNQGVSKEQWLAKALETLGQDGFEAVKINRTVKWFFASTKRSTGAGVVEWNAS